MPDVAGNPVTRQAAANTPMEEQVPDLLETVEDGVATLTLNRPEALNALSMEIRHGLLNALDRFADDSAVRCIVITGAGRAFCSGGDVRALGTTAPGPELDRMRRRFFAREYELDYLIHRYPKPFLALIDGITMGGGCGLSMHASHRISTERTVLAMPEATLGLFPDVGATWFLSRLPGEMGLYLGLTGVRLRAGDLRALHMATHHVESGAGDALATALCEADRLDRTTIDRILAGFAADPGPPDATRHQRRIDLVFAGETLADIVEALDSAPEDWAIAALGQLRRAAPTSLAAILRQLRGAVGLTPVDMFRTEYRLAVRLSGRNDFREGVRSILIDKDNAPRWDPARFEDVDPAVIEALFAPLAPVEPELELV